MDEDEVFRRLLAVEDRLERTGLPRHVFRVTVHDSGSITVESDVPGAMDRYVGTDVLLGTAA